MRIRRTPKLVSLLLIASLLHGCLRTERTLTYFGKPELQYYKDRASKIDYPDTAGDVHESKAFSIEPRRIRRLEKENIRDITLEEAVKQALANADIIRDAGTFLSPGNAILAGVAPSVYDPAIQESNVLFGPGRGIEAALSDFDAQYTTSMTWARSEQPSESANLSLDPGDPRVTEGGDYRSQIQKTLADGSQLAITHNWFYDGSNIATGAGGRLFHSHFTSRPSADQNGGLPTLGINFRRPMWAASGTEFTRIAGPNQNALNGVTGVAQGVVIARINSDISIANFEQDVVRLVKDVQDAYWDLYLAYRIFHSETVARNSAFQIRQVVEAKTGLEGAGAADLAQASSTWYEIRARAETAQSGIFEAEVRLRRLMGLPVNDGEILRPVDEPAIAEFKPNWTGSLVEALVRRPELRQQKWNIKSLELQNIAAKKLTRPQLDFVARYQVNGFGDRLTSSDETTPFSSALRTLTNGDYTGWGLGFEFQMPLGFRLAHTQVSNLEWQLTKARKMLNESELEISYELANAFQALDRTYKTAQTNFMRRLEAEKQVGAYEIRYEVATGPEATSILDLLLRSQINQSVAEIAYYSSLVDYNKSILELQFRKGSLLEDTNIYLAESEWTAAAYQDALRRAWARSHAVDSQILDHQLLHTEPSEFVIGPDQPGSMVGPSGFGSVIQPAPIPTESTQPWVEPQPTPPTEITPETPQTPGDTSPQRREPEPFEVRLDEVKPIEFQSQRNSVKQVGPPPSKSSSVSQPMPMKVPGPSASKPPAADQTPALPQPSTNSSTGSQKSSNSIRQVSSEIFSPKVVGKPKTAAETNASLPANGSKSASATSGWTKSRPDSK